MSVGAVMAGAAFVKLTMDDSSLQQGLNRAQKSIGKFSEAINVTLARLNLASTEMAAVFTAINMPMVGAIKAFGAFDDRMRQVQAVTGATGKSFSQLTEQAKKLGRETSFTAAQVSEGMLALGRMGLNPKEIEAAIQPMMNLARVTGTELGQAAEIAANNMRVFGLDASKMSHISDILSVTANSSAQTLADLGESLKMAGPHAKRAGADLTETAAALGILANMGIRGSLAGTALGKSYKRLADPKVMAYLKQYNVETLNADGSMRKMRDTLVDIAKAMKTMTNAEQITFAEEVFDARGSLGGGTLSVNTEGIDLLMEKLKNSEGAAQRAADVMENGIGGTLRRLSSAAEGVSLAFGEMLSVSFMPLINQASALCEVLRNIVKENAGVIGGISRFLYLGLGLGAVTKILFVIGSALKGIASPLVLAIKYLDNVVSGSGRAAVAAAVLEKQKSAAATASAAKIIAAEKMKTANELAETSKRVSAAALEQTANLENLKKELAANNLKIAAGKTRIAQLNAEAVASGKSASEAIAGEEVMQSKLAETNLELQQKIALQNASTTAAKKEAAAAAAAAKNSMDAAKSAANVSNSSAISSASPLGRDPAVHAAYTRNAEKLKVLEKQKSDAARTASESNRHFVEMKNASAEAAQVVKSETEKVAALKARVTQEIALNNQARAAYAASHNGSAAGFVDNAGLTAATSELNAQNAVVQKSIVLKQQAAAAENAALTQKKAAAAASVKATAAYNAELVAQSAASKKSLVYGAALGKLNVQKLFSAAFSRKHAQAVLTASMAEMVAAKKGAGASALRTAFYYVEAAGAKVAAGATVAFGAALTWLSAHPVMVALTVFAAAIWGINKAFNAANTSARELSGNAEKFSELKTQQREQGDTKRQDSSVLFERLKQLEELSKRGKITSEEMTEAEDIMKKLGPGAKSYIQTLDKTAGKLQLVADAQDQFNKNMTAAAKSQLNSEISALEAEKKALSNENDQLMKWYNHNLLSILTGRNEEAVKQIEVNGDKAVSIMQKIQAAKLRLKAIDGGDKNAVTGKEGESTEDRVEAEKQRKAASVQELVDATKRLAELDEEAAKRKRSNLENEIENIRKVRDEYKKNIDLLLEEEKAKLNANMSDVNANANGTTQAQKDAYAKALEAAEGNRKKIAELEARLAAANAGFDEQTKDAEKKDAERRDKERKPYAGFLGELDADKQKRDADKQTDKQFSDAMEGKNYDAAYALMDQLFNAQQTAMRTAREKYQKMYEAAIAADSEGGADLTDSERSKLDELRTEIRESASRMENYQSKMDEAREAAADAGERDPSSKISGAWQLADLAGALNNTAADRTAAATEKSVALQEKTNKRLEAIEKKSGSGTIKYS